MYSGLRVGDLAPRFPSFAGPFFLRRRRISLTLEREVTAMTARHFEISALDAVDRSALPEDGGPDFNRLIFTHSPYLLQHAANPVDWYPWGEAAFVRARAEDKPVFLSIGYSTCHWCHVMAHESFESPEVAAVLNRYFIAVKVDREERPDVDAVYMNACQLVTGSGGWPLTILLTPERRPFYAATYLPREPRGGFPGLIDLLERIAELWQSQRQLLLDSGERLHEALRSLERDDAPKVPITDRPLRQALARWRQSFDQRHGGFGGAPKFPTPHVLSLLWRLAGRLQDPLAARMAGATLRAIRHGGVYDQLGFGLHRYAVDAAWVVPHFEKMLYDQALFILAVVDGFQATGDADLAAMARDTVAYLLRDLRTAEGAFCCGEDADSEGEEGTFYLWTLEQIRETLPENLAEVAIRGYGMTQAGNFEGKNIPVRAITLPELARAEGGDEAAVAGSLEQARRQLLAARSRRIRPHRDDKLLAGWNGLALGAVARAGAVLGEREWVEAAAAAFDFLERELVDGEGRLRRSWRRGGADIPGFAEDYAFLGWGAFELYQATWQPRHLEAALHWNGELLRLFADDVGDLWECAADAEAVLGRGRNTLDGAIPAAGSLAALTLLRLGDLTGDTHWRVAGEQLLVRRLGRLGTHPEAHAQLLQALEYILGPTRQLVIVVPGPVAEAAPFLEVLLQRFEPRTVTLCVATDTPGIERLSLLAAGKDAVDGRVTAWLCGEQGCQLPVTSPHELGRLLDGGITTLSR